MFAEIVHVEVTVVFEPVFVGLDVDVMFAG